MKTNRPVEIKGLNNTRVIEGGLYSPSNRILTESSRSAESMAVGTYGLTMSSSTSNAIVNHMGGLTEYGIETDYLTDSDERIPSSGATLKYSGYKAYSHGTTLSRSNLGDGLFHIVMIASPGYYSDTIGLNIQANGSTVVSTSGIVLVDLYFSISQQYGVISGYYLTASQSNPVRIYGAGSICSISSSITHSGTIYVNNMKAY